MATMFPNRFPEDSNSSGERKVYEFFRDKAPSDWYVIHSFMLPEHHEVIFGEADFIVIAPGIGIVILEIKSGGVGFNRSEWLFRNRHGETTIKKRGPFAQAKEAMFELQETIPRFLSNSYDKFHILYNYGVIFTDESNFPIERFPEFEPWRLKQNDEINDYCKFIESLTENYKDELRRLGKRLPQNIDKTAAKAIADTLRPSVECVVPLKKFLQDSEDDIIKLTEEQFTCLDDIEENERIVITGGAGTGKTLIAVETANRASEKKYRTLFLCFNTNLAFFLKKQINKKDIEIHSFHQYLMSIYKKDIPENSDISSFFKYDLPQKCLKKINNDFEKFDYLIIDEFQDLCTKEYLDFLDCIVKNGLKNSSFAFFGDFSRQAIYNNESSIENLKNRTFFSKKKLMINCRNTENIGNEIINITGFSDQKYKLSITGEKVDYIVWKTTDEEKRGIKNVITNLNKLRIPNDQIIILSPNQRKKSIVNLIDEDKEFISDYEDQTQEGYFALFSTIHAFKGLESKVVILCDIEDYNNTNLMYVGLSRARSKLIIFESEKANKQRTELMARR